MENGDIREVLQRLTNIESKLDHHLLDHIEAQRRFRWGVGLALALMGLGAAIAQVLGGG